MELPQVYLRDLVLVQLFLNLFLFGRPFGWQCASVQPSCLRREAFVYDCEHRARPLFQTNLPARILVPVQRQNIHVNHVWCSTLKTFMCGAVSRRRGVEPRT